MDRPAIIHKSEAQWRVTPNLNAGEAARFSWDTIRGELAGLPGGGLNIAHEAVDRHARGPRRNHVAFRFLDSGDGHRDVSFVELAALTNRFAHVLQGLGVGPGDRVFILIGRIPELYLSVLGSFKNGSVVSTLFSAFGPEPIATRMNLGAATVLVTTPELYQRKVAGVRDRIPTLRHVLLASAAGTTVDLPGTLDLQALMTAANDSPVCAATGPEDLALLHFTSGTTGTPKGPGTGVPEGTLALTTMPITRRNP